MTNYEEKYLKYKIKYLKLKEELNGGAFLLPAVAKIGAKMVANQGSKMVANQGSKMVANQGSKMVANQGSKMVSKEVNKMKDKLIKKLINKVKNKNICIDCKNNHCKKCFTNKEIEKIMTDIITSLDFTLIINSKDFYKKIKDILIEKLIEKFKSDYVCSDCKNNNCSKCSNIEEIKKIIFDLNLETDV